MARAQSSKFKREEPKSLGVGIGPWATSHGMYITGSAAIDGMDVVAVEMETKWGADRLRLLVDDDLRARFDRQRYLVNNAIFHGDLEDVRVQSGRMVSAWRALDRAAEAAGALPLSPDVWEAPLPDGTVLAITRTGAEAHAVARTQAGRQMVVWSMAEVALFVASQREANQIKETFPGARVTVVRREIADPLAGLADSSGALDDEIPFG